MPESMLSVFSCTALGIVLALMGIMSAAWFTALKSGNAGWIDVFWTFGLGLVGIAACLFAGLACGVWVGVGGIVHHDLPPRAALCASLIGIWALRLGLHIAKRTQRAGDDPRYAQLRIEWGVHYRRRLFLFLQIQAIAGLPLLLSVTVAACRPGPFGGIRDVAGVILFLAALLGVSAADRALRRFSYLPHPRKAVCDIGLWRWSRHPNYFFEWLGWIVWPLMAAGVSGYAWGWFSVIAPVLMYWLLVHVSGIPPLEAHMARSRGAVWQAYATRTSVFFPRPPARE